MKLRQYLSEVVHEVKQVSWPNKQQTIDKTVLVIIVSLMTAVYIGGLDFLLQRIMTYWLNK